jgi:hypothetical protein
MRRLLLTSLLLVACGVLAMVASSVAGAATLSWSGPALIESQPPFANSPGLVDPACPTVRFCVSATEGGPSGTTGIEVSGDPTGGSAAWRYESAASLGVQGDFPLAVSCSSLRLCVVLVASGTSTFVTSSTAPATGTGNWTARPAPPGMTSLTCPTRKLCLGVADSSIEVTRHPREGARAWRAVAFKGGLFLLSAVACHGGHLCVAVGLRHHSGAVAVSTDPTGGRRAWHVTDLPHADLTSARTVAAACTSKDVCVITDDVGDVIASRNPAVAHPRWRASVVSDAGGSVSCPSPSFCLSIGAMGVATSHNPTGGRTAWSTTRWPSELKNGPGLACASARLCIGAGPGNEVLTSTAPAGGGPTFTLTQLNQGETALTAIVCPSAGVCLADGADGRLLRSNLPAGGPRAWGPIASNVDTPIGGLSCSSSTFCAGVAGHVVTGVPTLPTVTWTEGPVAQVAVSCASQAFCAAIDTHGDVLTTTDPGGGVAAWTTTQLPTSVSNGGHGEQHQTPLIAIACPTASFCAALDGDGNYWASSNPGAGASAWTEARLPPAQAVPLGAAQLDCPTASLCVAVTTTHVLTTSDPADPTPAWSTVALPSTTSSAPSTAVTGLSCASSSLCVAVNSNGWAVWGNPTTGDPWTAAPLGGLASLTAVSCAPLGLCVAGDSAGRIFTAQPS